MKKLTVTAEISTKDRYFSTLSLAILSIIQQTVKPDKIIIYDDGEQRDLRQDSTYANLFSLMSINGIEWTVNFGQRKGQVANHQRVISEAKTDLIWRVDDDDVMEPNCLEKLLVHMQNPEVAAASGVILIPLSPAISANVCSSKIEDVWGKPNLQWSNINKVVEVDHFNNSFLYRREYAKHGYCMELSPVGHGEETLFTYGFRKAGYKLILEPAAKIWHLRNPSGGIRAYKNADLWRQDTEVSLRKFKEWGVTLNTYKMIVLNGGLGDHLAFASILPEIRQKYPSARLQIACCYPAVFEGEPNIDLLSIQDAQTIVGDIEEYNIYKWCWDRGWSGSLCDAYRKMYGI